MPREKTILPGPIDLIEPDASIADLRDSAQGCRGCDIWQRATQVVIGEGAPGAGIKIDEL
jgi:uracil-DNA glycosylase